MARTKARAKNIGHVECPACHRVAPIRRTTPKGHTVADGLYYIMCGNDGLLKMTMPGGQEWIRKNGHLWGVKGCPDDMPDWIKKDWAYAPPELRDRPVKELEDEEDPPTVPAPPAVQPPEETEAAPVAPVEKPTPATQNLITAGVRAALAAKAPPAPEKEKPKYIWDL